MSTAQANPSTLAADQGSGREHGRGRRPGAIIAAKEDSHKLKWKDISMSIERRVTAGDDREMNDDDRELERMLAFYFECRKQRAVDALPDDEARELARRFHDLLAPAFEREFRLH